MVHPEVVVHLRRRRRRACEAVKVVEDTKRRRYRDEGTTLLRQEDKSRLPRTRTSNDYYIMVNALTSLHKSRCSLVRGGIVGPRMTFARKVRSCAHEIRYIITTR